MRDALEVSHRGLVKVVLSVLLLQVTKSLPDLSNWLLVDNGRVLLSVAGRVELKFLIWSNRSLLVNYLLKSTSPTKSRVYKMSTKLSMPCTLVSVYVPLFILMKDLISTKKRLLRLFLVSMLMSEVKMVGLRELSISPRLFNVKCNSLSTFLI